MENFRSQTIEITLETYKKVKRHRKIATISACDEPNKPKEHKNIQSKLNYQNYILQTNKNTDELARSDAFSFREVAMEAATSQVLWNGIEEFTDDIFSFSNRLILIFKGFSFSYVDRFPSGLEKSEKMMQNN